VGEIELPAIASPLNPAYIETVPPPSPPPPRVVEASAPVAPRAPIAAPDTIEPETDAPSPARDAVPGGIEVEGPRFSAASGLSDLGTSGSIAPPAPPPPPVLKPVRVGGTIREPRKLVHVAPIYPEIARQARVQGTVVMEAILDAAGRVESVRVLRSEPLLDEVAVRAVRQWRYTPTQLNGVPVPVLMTITIRFSLDR
jgi:protein TonB